MTETKALYEPKRQAQVSQAEFNLIKRARQLKTLHHGGMLLVVVDAHGRLVWHVLGKKEG